MTALPTPSCIDTSEMFELSVTYLHSVQTVEWYTSSNHTVTCLIRHSAHITPKYTQYHIDRQEPHIHLIVFMHYQLAQGLSKGIHFFKLSREHKIVNITSKLRLAKIDYLVSRIHQSVDIDTTVSYCLLKVNVYSLLSHFNLLIQYNIINMYTNYRLETVVEDSTLHFKLCT